MHSLRSNEGVSSGIGLYAPALCLGLLLASTGAGGANVYKWTDGDGTVNFSDKQAPDIKAEKLQIDTHTDDATAERLQQLEAAAEANRREREQAAAEAAEAAREKERIEAHCHEARAKYEQLKNARRPQYINEQGEREFIDEAQREKWLNAAQTEIDEHCKD
ncbi:MAG: DUF4124 domain-containing protein [Gammaproteobacteria bacterium]